jgi:hypothetical protein
MGPEAGVNEAMRFTRAALARPSDAVRGTKAPDTSLMRAFGQRTSLSLTVASAEHRSLDRSIAEKNPTTDQPTIDRSRDASDLILLKTDSSQGLILCKP